MHLLAETTPESEATSRPRLHEFERDTCESSESRFGIWRRNLDSQHCSRAIDELVLKQCQIERPFGRFRRGGGAQCTFRGLNFHSGSRCVRETRASRREECFRPGAFAMQPVY